MQINRVAGAFVFGLLVHVACAASAASLTLVTEDYPPFSMQKAGSSDVVGIATDLLRGAMKKAEIDYTVSLFPWKRAYESALKDADTCVYSTTRTEEREPLFKWIGPLIHNDWVLFGRTDSPKLASLDDAKAYRVGGYQGSANTLYLESQGFKVDEAVADRLNPKKLMANRIDFWTSGAILGPYLASREGAAGIIPILKFKDVEMDLACNKSVPDDVIVRLNAAIKQMMNDRSMETINKAYQ